MKFLCGSCRTKYQISDDKVRGKILTIRCKKCGAKILVRESLANRGETAVAPVAHEDSTQGPSPHVSSRPHAAAMSQTNSRSEVPAPAARGPAEHSTPRPTAPSSGRMTGPARTGGSAALASAYELAMGQGASDSDDMPTSIAPVPANLDIAGAEWYVAIDGQQQGPFAFAEVVKRVESGDLIGRHYVWHDGMENWTRLREVSDLAKYLPTPRSVPPLPPAPPEDNRPAAEVVELAARRARLDQAHDQEPSEAEAGPREEAARSAVLLSPSAPADRADRAEELDQAINDVLGIEGEGQTTRSPAQAGLAKEATNEVGDDVLASDDIFANIPRASGADDEQRESTRFFVAAAGVNNQRKRNRIGLMVGVAAAVLFVGFVVGLSLDLYRIELPGIGDPFDNMRQSWSRGDADDEFSGYSKDELARLGRTQAEREKKRKAGRGPRRSDDGSGLGLPSGGYVDDGAGSGGRLSPRGLTEAEKIAIGTLATDGAGGDTALPQADLPDSSPDLPAVDADSLSQEAVAKVVKQNSASVRLCYQQSLKGSKHLRGKLEIKLRVEPSGRVSKTEVQTSLFKGTRLAQCISRKIRKWTFPKSRGSAQEFLVPFVLEKSG